MHSEKCLICGGSGKVNPDGKFREDNELDICHGCNGKGWVEVSNEPEGWMREWPIEETGNYLRPMFPY